MVRMILRLMILLPLAALFALALPRLITGLYAWSRMFSVEESPSQPVAIVFGAGLWRDGSPTPVLRDRVESAARLYFAGKVEKLLMSGSYDRQYYNEPGAMKDFALELGVPEEAIVLDYAGSRTYDTCYRAREIFGVRRAILVTQKFHLPRALFLCNTLGVKATGVPADLREYRRRSLFYWNLREVPATLVALLEVSLTRPAPALGAPEPIFPEEAQ